MVKRTSTKKEKGGSLELGALAASGLLVAAQNLYKQVLKEEKKRMKGGTTFECKEKSPEASFPAPLQASLGGRKKRHGGTDMMSPLRDLMIESPEAAASPMAGGRHRKGHRGGDLVQDMLAGMAQPLGMDAVTGSLSAMQGSAMSGGKKRASRKRGGNSDGIQNMLAGMAKPLGMDAVTGSLSAMQGSAMSGGKKRVSRKHGGNSDGSIPLSTDPSGLSPSLADLGANEEAMPVPQMGGKKRTRRTKKVGGVGEDGGESDMPAEAPEMNGGKKGKKRGGMILEKQIAGLRSMLDNLKGRH